VEKPSLPEAKEKALRKRAGQSGPNPSQAPLERSAFHIEARKQVGHWECDRVIGANHKGVIVTMVERKSGFGVIVKVAKTSDLVSRAIVGGLQPFEDRVKTLTYDSGKEFATHIQIDQALKGTGYFARPFASWERGSKENFNGSLHQSVRKKRSLNTVDKDEITMIQTPAEVFHQYLKRVALRT
jgi:IS30 family transposase